MITILTRKRRKTSLSDTGLILTQKAYEKLCWFRNQAKTEVGAFGISSPDDYLLIEDFAFLPQECTTVTTEFNVEKQTEWIESMMMKGISPDRFMRVWAHTHPMESASPSYTDWETFQDVFANSNWGVMLILGSSNEFSCTFRCRDQIMDLGEVTILKPCDDIPEAWSKEFKNIREKKYASNRNAYVGTPLKEAEAIDKLLAISSTKDRTDFWKWEPDIDLLISKGIANCLSTILDLRRDHPTGPISYMVDKATKMFCKAVFDDEKFIEKYNCHDSAWYSLVSALYVARRDNLDLDGLKTKYLISEDDAQHFTLNSNGTICLTDEPIKDIYKRFSSTMQAERLSAYSDIMAAVMYFSDFPKTIDKILVDSHFSQAELEELYAKEESLEEEDEWAEWEEYKTGYFG